LKPFRTRPNHPTARSGIDNDNYWFSYQTFLAILRWRLPQQKRFPGDRRYLSFTLTSWNGGEASTCFLQPFEHMLAGLLCAELSGEPLCAEERRHTHDNIPLAPTSVT
jgi:hypothetical protein